MSKVSFVKLINEGIAQGELNGVVTNTKWFTLELAVIVGMTKKSVKVNVWEKDVVEDFIRAAKTGDFYGNGAIKTVYVQKGYEINGRVVNSVTVYVDDSTTLEEVLSKRGIVLSIPEEVMEA